MGFPSQVAPWKWEKSDSIQRCFFAELLLAGAVSLAKSSCRSDSEKYTVWELLCWLFFQVLYCTCECRQEAVMVESMSRAQNQNSDVCSNSLCPWLLKHCMMFVYLTTFNKEGLTFVKRWENGEMWWMVLRKVMAELGIHPSLTLAVPGHPSQSLPSLEQP